jgi:hypothetical protein
MCPEEDFHLRVGRLKEILFTRKAIRDVLGLIPLHLEGTVLAQCRITTAADVVPENLKVQ